jgi:predicted nuclease with TOPRIM domain
VETISGEDDIVEMSMDENSNEKEEMQQEASQVQEESSEMQQKGNEVQQEVSEVQQEASQKQKKPSIIESPEQQNFLYTIGLITKSKCIELQNKRVERKRRSTANPHFVYSMLEQPSVSVNQYFCYYIRVALVLYVDSIAFLQR